MKPILGQLRVMRMFEPGRAVAALAFFFCVLGPATVAAQGTEAAEGAKQNVIVGIGVCPPWHPQSVEVCHHSVNTVINAFTGRLGLGPADTHLLFSEGASADGLKKTITELANNLGPQDRLIIYANLRSTDRQDTESGAPKRQLLQLWADNEPDSADAALEKGIWISASAFAAMLHTVPAGEVILILDTSNSDTIDSELLESHATNLDDRPEALITSAGDGQTANYSADRTIALFAKHLAFALETANGSFLDVLQVAASGTRQAAIPICMALREGLASNDGAEKDCTQIPQIHDPAGILATIPLPDVEPAAEK